MKVSDLLFVVFLAFSRTSRAISFVSIPRIIGIHHLSIVPQHSPCHNETVVRANRSFFDRWLVPSAHAYEKSPTTSSIDFRQILTNSLQLLDQTPDEIKELGWNEVHRSSTMSLYKRRDISGAVVYLLLGRFDDVTTRQFFNSQVLPTRSSQQGEDDDDDDWLSRSVIQIGSCGTRL